MSSRGAQRTAAAVVMIAVACAKELPLAGRSEYLVLPRGAREIHLAGTDHEQALGYVVTAPFPAEQLIEEITGRMAGPEWTAVGPGRWRAYTDATRKLEEPVQQWSRTWSRRGTEPVKVEYLMEYRSCPADGAGCSELKVRDTVHKTGAPEH